MLAGIKDGNGRPMHAGEYRTGQVMLRDVPFRPAPAESVPSQIRYLLKEYDGKIAEIHPIEAAAYFHQKFEEIHPFQDGNGRTGREILNWMLARQGFPPICIMPDRRSAYLTALQDGNAGNLQSLFDFVLERMFATIAYLSVHANLYDVWASPEVRQAAKENGMEKGYGLFLAMTKQAVTKRDIP